MSEAEIQFRPSVADLPDSVLICRAMRSIYRPVSRGHSHTMGQAVMATFALGSTYAAQLCKRFGLDPDVMVRK